jgi:hypothetical protein
MHTALARLRLLARSPLTSSLAQLSGRTMTVRAAGSISVRGLLERPAPDLRAVNDAPPSRAALILLSRRARRDDGGVGGRKRVRLQVSAGDERQEFRPCRHRLSERPEHGGRGHHRILLLHAPHHHAEVLRLDHDADAIGADALLDRVRNLIGQPFLDLEPTREVIDHPRQL